VRKALRKVHRWLGVLVAAQVVAWMVSGFYFSLFPIEEIRGEHLTRPAPTIEPGQLAAAAPFTAIGDTLTAALGPGWRLDTLELQPLGGRLVWRAVGEAGGQPFRRLLPEDGSAVLPPLSAEDAARRAAEQLRAPAEPVHTEWIGAGEGGHDLRGRAGPAWKVSFARPEAVDLYLDPWTGEVAARRTDRWRLFDFLWMLHIMDYGGRENFNHPLLQAAAVAGLLVALSGFAYWLATRRRRRVASARRAVDA
jgi:uncharacterized iron-regulated membrane protein